MRKVEKSKNFKYNLRTVLKVREIFEKQEKEKFNKAEKEYREEIRKEKEIKDKKRSQEDQLASKLVGEMKDFTSIMNRHAYLRKMKVDVEKQVEKREESEQKKEEQRERLIQAVKDRKILEKDREHKRKDWGKVMNREEIKFLSDIANTAYVRRKIEQVSQDELKKQKAEEEEY
jgi:flagellar protein FliJ